MMQLFPEPARWVLLPQGYPGEWNYRVQRARQNGTMRPLNIERVQFSLREADYQGDARLQAADDLRVESITHVLGETRG